MVAESLGRPSRSRPSTTLAGFVGILPEGSAADGTGDDGTVPPHAARARATTTATVTREPIGDE